MAIFPQVKYLNIVFKGLLILLLTGILYFELTARENLSEIWAVFQQQLLWANIGWLILALALMPFNWLAETHKWHQFMTRYEPMSRWKALQAVLAGVTVSLFTPNRVGEYGGRVLFVRPENRWKAVIVNLVGNFAQLMVLMTVGAAGVAWLMGRFWLFEPLYIQLFVLLATIGLGILFIVYFNIKTVIPIARKIPVLHRIKRFVKDLRVLEHFSRRELASILKWSTIRYSIFAAQYFFLLKFFDIKTSLVDGYASISVLFLLQASLPLPPITGLVARGTLAVQMWKDVSPNEVSSLAATCTLWIINLILPALVGTFSILYVNIAKTFVYENDRH
ncbi:MAG: lysylphosphatidylglycerol synthase transmembrane domain-containing protein [Saprospiraceae bacterium]|nr:lysylphosphatidylglycerol synthase transmembrane domain-containing protein [Saprospiraceae bacterium]